MKLYALLRKSPSQSHSPFIHNRIMELLGVDGQYGTLEVPPESIPQVIDALKVLGYGGINVTIPYKQDIIPFLDWISPEAATIGAVNTVKVENGYSKGYNTDYFGFGFMLEEAGIQVKDQKIVLLGTGGAAKALIAYLENHGVARLLVAARSPDKLAVLKREHPDIETCSIGDLDKLYGDVLINSTPVGQPPALGQTPVPPEAVTRFSAVADIIAVPTRTALLDVAQKAGIKNVSGLSMLLYQAFKSQEIYQGHPIDLSVAQTVFEELKARVVAG